MIRYFMFSARNSTAGKSPARRPVRLSHLLLFLFALAAPTAGDIGSCGQPIADLDPLKFFAEKQFYDCQMCTDCGFATQFCELSCDDIYVETDFPENCFPLVHDGEVCLGALRATSCGDYVNYVGDSQPTTPSECNFCPVDQGPNASAAQTSGAGGGAQ